MLAQLTHFHEFSAHLANELTIAQSEASHRNREFQNLEAAMNELLKPGLHIPVKVGTAR